MLDIIQTIFYPGNLLMMNLGVFIGILVGVLPGLTGVFAITVLLPFTFGMESIPGMYLLLGAYWRRCLRRIDHCNTDQVHREPLQQQRR